MRWGDILCGLEVTPESWDMGVVEFVNGGSWECGPSYADLQKLYKGGLRELCCKLARSCRPIFPPRGWGGLSDDELWEAATGFKLGHWYMGDHPAQVRFIRTDHPWVSINPKTEEEGCCDCRYLPALILALQNAQVLAARMGVK